ncbi:MAG: hypothetical protein ACR2HH_06590 [Chthoniobacterales bacterium]
MSFNPVGDQFVIVNIVRAFGQPFTIVPATATLVAKDAGDESAIFNIGGNVGIAILSPFVTRRAQFHDRRIGDAITVYDPNT